MYRPYLPSQSYLILQSIKTSHVHFGSAAPDVLLRKQSKVLFRTLVYGFLLDTSAGESFPGSEWVVVQAGLPQQTVWQSDRVLLGCSFPRQQTRVLCRSRGWGQRLVKPSAVRAQTDGMRSPWKWEMCRHIQGTCSSDYSWGYWCNYCWFKVAIFCYSILCLGVVRGHWRLIRSLQCCPM